MRPWWYFSNSNTDKTLAFYFESWPRRSNFFVISNSVSRPFLRRTRDRKQIYTFIIYRGREEQDLRLINSRISPATRYVYWAKYSLRFPRVHSSDNGEPPEWSKCQRLARPRQERSLAAHKKKVSQQYFSTYSSRGTLWSFRCWVHVFTRGSRVSDYKWEYTACLERSYVTSSYLLYITSFVRNPVVQGSRAGKKLNRSRDGWIQSSVLALV
jgi:hypothetical protein